MNYSRHRSQYENKESVCAQCSGELTKKEMGTRLCPCGYQICHWCLSRILQEKATCPDCGRSYSNQVLHLLDNSSESQYSDSSSTLSNEYERRRNSNAKGVSPDISYLQSVRIIQRNLVYIIGLSPSITNESSLRSSELFGQYGTIKKVILNNSPQLIEKVHSCCAYITYSKPQEALDCIMATDGCVLRGSQIRSSFGTTKYCNFFLRGIRCTNTECMYLHHMAEEGDCFTKKEMMLKQAEFFARTHPCHSDMNEVPMGKSVSSLPPPCKNPSLSYLKNPSSSVCLLMDGELIPRPFQASRVLADDYEMYEALTTFASMMVEDTSCLLSKSSTSIDLSFLFKADEYIKQIQKQRDLSIESWNWRQMNRSNSIDSDKCID